MKKSRWFMLVGMGVLALGITAAVANATSSPDDPLPLDKQAIENNYANLKHNSQPAPAKSSDTSLKPVQHEKLPSGILNQFTPPFHAEDVTIRNVWQNEVNGELVQVYAGNLYSDSEQGIVIVRTTAADGVNTTESRYLTPDKAGAVKIEAENNMKLSLKSDKGKSYEFDVKSKGLSKK